MRPPVWSAGRTGTSSGLQPCRVTVDPLYHVALESGLFFANSDHVRERIEAMRTPQTRIVVLDVETSPFIDISAAEMLAQLASSLARDGIELRIARDIGQFRDVMRSAVPEAFHHDVFRTIDEALNAPPDQSPE